MKLKSLVTKARRTYRRFTAALIFLTSTIGGFGTIASAEEIGSLQPPALLEDFEEISDIYASSIRVVPNSVKVERIGRPDAVKSGYYAAKLTYDFTETVGVSAAYMNLRDNSGAIGRPVEGYPKKFGMWVYGDGNKHWLRAQIQDASGVRVPIDFTLSGGLNWHGWKFVTSTIPQNLTPPLKLNQIYVAETLDYNKNAGQIFFDHLQAFYDDSTLLGIQISGLTPMQQGENKQIRVLATYNGGTGEDVLTSGVVFSSSNPGVASVGADGLVTALTPGETLITATAASAEAAVYHLTVSEEAPVPDQLLLEGTTKLLVGGTSNTKVYAVYGIGTEPIRINEGIAFQSSAPDVASIDESGYVHALRPGTTALSASFMDRTSTFTLSVSEPVPVLQKIEIVGPSSLNIGHTMMPRVVATYSYMNESVDVTSQATLTSGNPQIVSVENNALSGLQVGVTTITARFEGRSDTHTLVVQKENPPMKRQLRAAWVATVDNIDWPSKKGLTAEQQQSEFINILDELEYMGMNAVIMQIKPTADAFYPSEFGPWSEYLSGVQGEDPGYDPLAFMVEEAHKRNLEFHAWFNPYRISQQGDINKLVEDHPARQHPEWVLSYGNKLYYNPGIPEAKDHIIAGMMEVVKKYDVDGVHLDDYFYPYPIAGQQIPDEATYQAYGASMFLVKADWRRNNVNVFVKELSEQIKQEKQHVKFGISPFGIWRNKADDPSGSDTNGLRNYDDLFADVRKWVMEGWVDYITPQIYWHFGNPPAAYEKVIDWWLKETADRNLHFYVGQAAYKIGGADPEWKNPEQIPNQLKYNQSFDGIHGSTFFSMKSLMDNLLGIRERLHEDSFKHPALIPTMPWLDSIAPQTPEAMAARIAREGVHLTWSEPASGDAAYYVVYRFNGEQAGDMNNPENILKTVRKTAGSGQSFIDETAAEGQLYTYVITAVDRLHNESTASSSVTVSFIPDITAPVTTADVTGSARNGWYVNPPTIQLTAVDEQSGIHSTEYRLGNTAEWTPYTQPITLQQEGVHTLSFRSSDKAGNVEAAKTLTLSIDTSAPTLEIVGARTYDVSEQVLITCAASDTVSGVVYNPCTGPLVDAPAYELGLGNHEITVQVEDRAGQIGSETVTYSILVTYEGLSDLTRLFVTGPGEQGIENSLLMKLEHGQLDSYVHEVTAQKDKILTAEQADILIAFAKALE